MKRHYGLAATEVTPLWGEVDSNFRVRSDAGPEYLVKVSHRGESGRPAVEWTTAVLAHLAEHHSQIPVPRLVAAADGTYVTAMAQAPGAPLLQVMTWQPGTVLARLRRPPGQLWAEVGITAGKLHQALRGLRDGRGGHTHYWDLRHARGAVEQASQKISDAPRRALLENVMIRYDRAARARETLPQAVVHHDLSDFNLLVQRDGYRVHHVSGIVDFSDALYTIRVAELAIACAYAMLGSAEPLARAAAVVRGYNSVTQVQDAELSALFGLIAGRAATNAATWASRAGTRRDPGAARISRAWDLLGLLDQTPGDFAEATFRHACGKDPWPAGSALLGRLGRVPAAGQRADGAGIRDTRTAVAGGGYGQRRRTGPGEPALTELGCPLPLPAGAAVVTPLAGVAERADAGRGLLMLRHDTQGLPAFWSQWSGITPAVPAGADVTAGQEIGLVRRPPGEPASAPAHLQLITSPDLISSPVPRFVAPSAAAVWEAVSPPPGALIGVPAARRPQPGESALRQRGAHAAASQRTYFRMPMNVVSSRDVWLYDDSGYSYLDAINNVSHVGHCHPAVTEAIARQAGELNTNSRLLYEGFGQYAERLSALLPPPLDTVFFTCTGSEANDLALRIVRQVTGREDVVVVDGAYHGNTTAVQAISPDRFWGPGGGGRPASTHVVPQPNLYRGRYRYADSAAGRKYAGDAAAVIGEMVSAGHPPAAMFAESLIGTGGELPLPPGYLAAAFESVRRAGGLCVCDEIQVGLGRLGSGMWGFTRHGVVPDVVTLGKPLGNGMPLAAVVTTREIAGAFDNGLRYFNTFAGNPVSCAAGIAVLDVIEREGLVQQAQDVGAYLLRQLRNLAGTRDLIGDVRGEGLYLGVELVRDPASLEPAGAEALHVCERMKEEGVLIYPNGAHGNVLKIKPPMTFRAEHADLLAEILDQVLGEEW